MSYVSVITYGADPTGVADSTAAIQAALDAVTATASEGGTVYAPFGTYRLDGTVVVDQLRTFKATAGSRFFRKSSQSSSIAPLFHGKGNYWEMDFDGAWLTTENDSYYGVVCCGVLSPETETYSNLFWKLRNARIFARHRGELSSPVGTGLGIGIYIASAQPFAGANAANYFGLVDDIAIHNATEAVWVGDGCNGHVFDKLRVEFFYNRAMKMFGAYGNEIRSCFINGCHQADQVAIELKQKGYPSAPHASSLQSNRNRITVPCMELYQPAIGVKIEELCQLNYVQMNFSPEMGDVPFVVLDDSNTIVEGYETVVPNLNITTIAYRANETAAAGLPQGRVYATSTGELRIKL